MPAPFSPTPRLLGFALGVLLLPLTGDAELVWQGTPAFGPQIFNNLNFEGAERYSPGTGTIQPATDPVRGPVAGGDIAEARCRGILVRLELDRARVARSADRTVCPSLISPEGGLAVIGDTAVGWDQIDRRAA